MDDLGRLGRIWSEADAETTDLETVISDLLTGQYSSPVRVVAFNTAERWSEDEEPPRKRSVNVGSRPSTRCKRHWTRLRGSMPRLPRRSRPRRRGWRRGRKPKMPAGPRKKIDCRRCCGVSGAASSRGRDSNPTACYGRTVGRAHA